VNLFDFIAYRSGTCAVGKKLYYGSKYGQINIKKAQRGPRVSFPRSNNREENFGARIDRRGARSMQIWRQLSAGGSGSQKELQYGSAEWGVLIMLCSLRRAVHNCRKSRR